MRSFRNCLLRVGACCCCFLSEKATKRGAVLNGGNLLTIMTQLQTKAGSQPSDRPRTSGTPWCVLVFIFFFFLDTHPERLFFLVHCLANSTPSQHNVQFLGARFASLRFSLSLCLVKGACWSFRAVGSMLKEEKDASTFLCSQGQKWQK